MRAPMLLLSLTVAGCTVGPDYVRPDVDIPAGWRTAKADAEDIANTAWWSLVEDPVLDGLLRIALASNKDVHLAAARIDEFAARIGIADAAARPQVDFGASAAREGASAGTCQPHLVQNRAWGGMTNPHFPQLPRVTSMSS